MNLSLKKSKIPPHLLKYFISSNPKYKSGDLVNIPHLVADALQADGWVLRQDIIWSKPSPMPESVRNRCTKAHEYVFLLTKGMKYYYDAEAIKEKSKYPGDERHLRTDNRKDAPDGCPDGGSRRATGNPTANLSNKRSVWSVDDHAGLLNWLEANAPEALSRFLEESKDKHSVWRVSSQGYAGAHFATFPPRLITPMILAGTSAHGCCTTCGTPWVRVTEERQLKRERPNDYVKRTGEAGTGNSCANTVAGVEVRTVGWRPNCECHGKLVKRQVEVENKVEHTPEGWMTGRGAGGHTNLTYSQRAERVSPAERAARARGTRLETITEYESDLPLEDHPLTPCTVLDPFVGSGTTCCVSLAHGRHSIGIDLSEQYLRNNAIPRIEGELLARPALTRLLPKPASLRTPVELGGDVADSGGLDD